jgi:hypothetical protein
VNRRLLSALRRVERRTRLRAEWTASGTTYRFFGHVPKTKRPHDARPLATNPPGVASHPPGYEHPHLPRWVSLSGPLVNGNVGCGLRGGAMQILSRSVSNQPAVADHVVAAGVRVAAGLPEVTPSDYVKKRH